MCANALTHIFSTDPCLFIFFINVMLLLNNALFLTVFSSFQCNWGCKLWEQALETSCQIVCVSIVCIIFLFKVRRPSVHQVLYIRNKYKLSEFLDTFMEYLSKKWKINWNRLYLIKNLDSFCPLFKLIYFVSGFHTRNRSREFAYETPIWTKLLVLIKSLFIWVK